MIRSNVNWNGQAHQMILDAAWEGLKRATLFFWQQCTQAVNDPAPARRVRRTRDTVAGKKGSTYKLYDSPSPRTGTSKPPYKRTGQGQRNIGYELDQDGMASRVGIGTPAKYMAILEIARGRKWLMSTLEKVKGQLQVLAGGR